VHTRPHALICNAFGAHTPPLAMHTHAGAIATPAPPTPAPTAPPSTAAPTSPPPDANGRASGALAQYLFTADACAAGTPIADTAGAAASTFGDLDRAAAVACLNHIGVSSTSGSPTAVRLTSQSTAAALAAALNSGTGFTLELWLRHEALATTATSASILSISSGTSGATAAAAGRDCPAAADLVLYRSGAQYALSVKHTSDVCGTVIFSPTITNGAGPVHVSITFDMSAAASTSATATVYINGAAADVKTQVLYPNRYIGSGNFAPDFTTVWNPTYRLQLLSDYRTADAQAAGETHWAPWAGELYLAALYGRALTAAEVSGNYAAALPNSAPAVTAVSFTVEEDGEDGDHYSSPEYYLTEVPLSDLAALTLPTAYDFESDVGNAIGYSVTNPLPLLHLASLPTRGTVYDSSGAAITAVPHTLADGTFRFRPVKDESSGAAAAYATFAYYATDGATGARSTADGTVTLHVLPKNDPPVAAAATFQASTGAVSDKLCVTGTDSDAGDGVVSAAVVLPPLHGILYQVVADVITGTVLTAGASFGGGQLCVGYKYTGAGGAGVGGSAVAGSEVDVDAFTFTVFDGSGHASAAQTAVLQVLQGG
jgi:hypothetical protein